MPAGPVTHSPWQAGWLTTARRVDSPNFGPRPNNANIDLIVLHAISLPP
ncbi:MAG: 1,6-anhydro-N-acetylmuramyl-L-alanine amidase AmpD, partial [Betaproteobacteria bacterium]|nr:1,6-anhydro-N-acetylmuramyl-L-alanine amidase AmpD [Betaproteobacteria bacterium]